MAKFKGADEESLKTTGGPPMTEAGATHGKRHDDRKAPHYGLINW